MYLFALSPRSSTTQLTHYSSFCVAENLGGQLLNRHYINVLLLSIIGLAVVFYFYLVGLEEKYSGVRTALDSATMNSAAKIIAHGAPFLVYGTAWKKEKTAGLVHQAVKAGFRFIDTACQPKHYNEPLVGEGWKRAADELGLDRSDIFLQTKFTSYHGQDPNHCPYDPKLPVEEQVRQSLQVSLTNLKTPYLDSLVMHSPMETFDETLKVWRVMEGFVDDDKVLRLGMSNCYDYDYFVALYEAARIKPSVLQNRFRAETQFDTELRQFCKEHGIWYQSFWTLTANRAALDLPEVHALAREKHLTPQTLLFAFLMTLGYVTPLSGTTSENHMALDVDVMARMQKGQVFFENEAELRSFARILGMPDL